MRTDSRTWFRVFVALLLVGAVVGPAPAKSASARPAGVSAFWWADGTCETGHIGEPGDGAPRFDWGKQHRHLEGSRYEGFTGFAPSTWQWWAREVGVLTRYPHAYDAPPAVQVRVASYGLHTYGRWGCMLSHPDLMNLPGR